MQTATGQMAGTLQDPTLELHNANGVIDSNDNWRDSPQASAIQNTGMAPKDDRESALLQTLAPGQYTAVVRGKNNTTGIGLAEVYDIDAGVDSQIANLSSRGFVQTGDSVMIGGFMVGPPTAGKTDVLVRAIGPSLSSQTANALQDPTLELHDSNGTTFASNDDWKSSQQADIEATGLVPKDDRESAILVRPITPGSHTAVVRGKTNGGLGLVEIYNLP